MYTSAQNLFFLLKPKVAVVTLRCVFRSGYATTRGVGPPFDLLFQTQSLLSIALFKGTAASALNTAFPAIASNLWVVSLLKNEFDLLWASTIVTAEARMLPGMLVDLARSYL